MQATLFDCPILAPELQMQALDEFPDWFKKEYGIDLLGEKLQEPYLHSESHLKEALQKIASILVDMVIDEQKSLKRYD